MNGRRRHRSRTSVVPTGTQENVGDTRSRLSIPFAPLLQLVAPLLDIEVTPDQQREHLSLETIEMMAALVERTGRIQRSHASLQDPSTSRCPDCSRFAATPLSPEEVIVVRRIIRRARLDDGIAYAFAKTTVLVTAASRSSMCDCDLRAWTTAIAEHARAPDAAWRSIGVTP